MGQKTRHPSPLRALAIVAAIAAVGIPAGVLALAAGLGIPVGALAADGAASAASTPSSSGGAPIGGLAPTNSRRRRFRPPSGHGHGHWLSAVLITEYWPAPERWFVGKRVKTPGLGGRHRIDWLYSAMGVSMQGEGIGLDRRRYHIDALGDGGWVTRSGSPTSAADGWTAGPPYWRAGGYWSNRSGAVTFPLQSGGWSAGAGRGYVPLPGVSFAPGPSLPLRFYQSIAVDPAVIPLGSRVYIPAYRRDRYGGWFLAQDTGGAINGRRVDVYRSPPASSNDSGQYLVDQRIYVIVPRR